MPGNGRQRGPIARRPAKKDRQRQHSARLERVISENLLPKAVSAGYRAIRWRESGWAGALLSGSDGSRISEMRLAGAVERKSRRGLSAAARWGAVEAPKVIADPDRLREHDLDAAVLRFAYAWRRRHAQVVHAATTDDHIAARHAETLERSRDRVGAPLGQPLVVAGRPRGVGEAGNRELHAAAGFVVVGCERDDLLALRRDVVLIPVEEHEEHLVHRRRWRRRWGRRRWRRRRAELYRQGPHDVLCVVTRFVVGSGSESVGEGERSSGGAESRFCASQVAISDVEGQHRADVKPDAGNRLIPEIPYVARQECAADRRAPWNGCGADGRIDRQRYRQRRLRIE